MFDRRLKALLHRLRRVPLLRHALVGSPELWRMKRKFQIDFLLHQGLKPTDWLCDLGCGTLRGGIPIIRYLEHGHYWGVDVRADVLVEARRELRRASLETKKPRLLHVARLHEARWDARFDVVWAFSTLIHMTDEVLAEALGFVGRHLQPAGRFYANVVLDPRHRGSWREFPVVGRSLHEYERLCERAGFDARDLGTLESLGHLSGRPAQDAQHMLEMARRAAPRVGERRPSG